MLARLALLTVVFVLAFLGGVGGRTCVAQAAPQAEAKHAAVRPIKPRSAWNTLRANLRHEERTSRTVLCNDDDDDDDDDEDVIVPTLADRSQLDGGGDEDGSGVDAQGPLRVALEGRDVVFVAGGELLRAASGHHLGTERPPRA